ncbi:MAG: glutamate 5-kinase [Cryobacterium sp.]|nr:glutamate 5-kinase [Cryobacterium sp.]MBX3104660.1 glutamate 5-kinase [Cryobacterium sp.]
MSQQLSSRNQIPSARRVVVKVGSSSISGTNASQLPNLVDTIAVCHSSGTEVVLVSSGAIATGLPFLNLSSRPTDLPTQQAAAAVGQSLLIHRYQVALERYAITAGQVLLTAGDLENVEHRDNAKRAMERLLALRILPIVNENDTVATHEIRFGDNDRLAALVSELVDADLLLLLSDVDGLYTKPPSEPGAEIVREVGFDDRLEGISLGGVGLAGLGTGGAVTKVSAARHANSVGIPTLLTSTEQFAAALAGEHVGTWFEPAIERTA